MKILVAEDDAVTSAVLEASLASLGHEVVMARDGEQAWDILASTPIRAVISDWHMPSMNGLELCSRVRNRSSFDYVYFILLTKTSASTENQEQACAAGVDDFMVKPVSPLDLKMRLHVASRILGYTAAIQQLESFIPICSYCKNIRKDDGYWQQIESYISQRTRSQFSHSICPSCYDQIVVPQLLGCMHHEHEHELQPGGAMMATA